MEAGAVGWRWGWRLVQEPRTDWAPPAVG